MSTKPKVGDRFYAVRSGRGHNFKGWATVSRVGRLYLYVGADGEYNELDGLPFDLQSLAHYDSNWPVQLYASEADYEAELELQALKDRFRKVLGDHFSNPALSLDAARRIDAILKEESL